MQSYKYRWENCNIMKLISVLCPRDLKIQLSGLYNDFGKYNKTLIGTKNDKAFYRVHTRLQWLKNEIDYFVESSPSYTRPSKLKIQEWTYPRPSVITVKYAHLPVSASCTLWRHDNIDKGDCTRDNPYTTQPLKDEAQVRNGKIAAAAPSTSLLQLHPYCHQDCLKNLIGTTRVHPKRPHQDYNDERNCIM